MATSRIIENKYLIKSDKTVSYIEDISHNVGIYKWTNKINGRIYIGKSINLYNRYIRFKYFNKAYSGDAINNARSKYNNISLWNYEVLEFTTKDNIEEKEIFYIGLFNSTDKNIGYNISLGGDGGKGLTKESILKQIEKRSKPIYQMDIKTNNIIRYWNSARDVENKLGYDSSAITKCCRGKRCSVYGYIWQYVNDPMILKQNNRRKRVLQLNKITDDVINEWESLSMAAKAMNGNVSNINACCRGAQNSCYGYKWRYRD